jgi:type I restriction enzyme S subunit
VFDRYFYYVFESDQFQKRIIDNTHGGAMQNLVGMDIFRNTVIATPALDEQRAIAAALSDVDSLIAALDKLISKKRAVKTAAMEQLLTGKQRLPGFEIEEGRKQTEAGEIPKDWSVSTLGDLFSFKNGLNKSKEYFGYGKPIVNYMDVYNRFGIHTTDIRGRVSVNKQELKAFGVKRGDVFFTRTSETVEEIGIAAVMLDEPQDAVFSGFVLRARPKDDSLEEGFKKYCFASLPVRKQITSKSTYTTRALTNGRVLSAVSLACPPKEEQNAIATVLSDMDAEIEALEARREKTRRIKQGMMQELLTGRTRLV